MNLTKGQKTMLALFLAVVVLVIVLWVTGVFKSSLGFKYNNQSRFGAIGAQTMTNSGSTSGSTKFVINYTNPASFGTLGTTRTIESVWNGLLLSVSRANDQELSLNSTPNISTATVALVESNPFYKNRYLNALKNYYGDTYNPSGNYNPNNAAYNAFNALNDNAKAALQFVLKTVLSSKLSDVVVANIIFDPVFKLTDPEIGILRTEIERLIRFIATFRSSPSFIPDTPNINNYANSSFATLRALEGVYVGVSGTMGLIRESVQLVTVKQTSWLDLTPGPYKFGVGIINSNLTIGTGDQYKFPFMVSDMIESVTALGRTTTSNNPDGLTVTTTYWP